MILPPGIDNGAFVVSPDTVWYARVLLLFSASATTDTGSKSFDCSLVSTLEAHTDPENGYYLYYIYYIYYLDYFVYYDYYYYYGYYGHYLCIAGWLKLVGYQIVYEFDHRKPILYVIPIQNILGKLPVVPVGDTGTIPHHLLNFFPGAPGVGPATASRVLAMDAGCGLSTRGHRGGPVICNEWELGFGTRCSMGKGSM